MMALFRSDCCEEEGQAQSNIRQCPSYCLQFSQVSCLLFPCLKLAPKARVLVPFLQPVLLMPAIKVRAWIKVVVKLVDEALRRLIQAPLFSVDFWFLLFSIFQAF